MSEAPQTARTEFWREPTAQAATRIAVDGYPWVSAPVRVENAGSVATWGRYDSPGQTCYAAQDAVTAFAEVLSPLKRKLGDVDPLEGDAAALGIPLEALLRRVAEEWAEGADAGRNVIAARWRARRRVLTVELLPSTQSVEVEHPDTIAELERDLAPVLAGFGVPQFTTGVLRGEARDVTVAIGTYLRTALPAAAGLRFGSKHGGGWCIAAWLDDRPTPIAVDRVNLITRDDPALVLAAQRFGLLVL